MPVEPCTPHSLGKEMGNRIPSVIVRGPVVTCGAVSMSLELLLILHLTM